MTRRPWRAQHRHGAYPTRAFTTRERAQHYIDTHADPDNWTITERHQPAPELALTIEPPWVTRLRETIR